MLSFKLLVLLYNNYYFYVHVETNKQNKTQTKIPHNSVEKKKKKKKKKHHDTSYQAQ